MLKTASILRKDYPVASADERVGKTEERLGREGYLVLTDVNPFGLVTQRSVLESGHILLGDCIHRLPTVAPESDLEEISSIMNRHSTPALLVCRENVCFGVAVSTDVSQALFEYNMVLGEAVRRKTGELEQSRDYFIRLANSIPAIFFALNSDLHITYWGKLAAVITGIAQESALGKRLIEFYTFGPDRERIAGVVHEVIATGKCRRTTFKHDKRRYNLDIYPFGDGVTIVARNRAEEYNALSRDAAIYENEMKKTGQVLHNEIGQYLSALSLRCAELEEKSARRAAVTRKDISALHDLCITANETLHGLMNSILWKADEHLSDRDLVNCICREVEKTFDVTVAVNVAVNVPDRYLPDNTCGKRHVTRFIQEALINAARHSGRKSFGITAERTNGFLILRISDDGCGFEMNSVRNGSGLRLMQFNADELGGELRIESGSGGTTVILKLPE